MIQPFLREVQRQGEWSFIYFDRAHTHTVVKRPAAGDFRVQNDFGGSSELVHAPDHLLEQASSVLKCVDAELLYARVDGIEVDGKFLVMELELIDPSLFLKHSVTGTAAFADAIMRRLE